MKSTDWIKVEDRLPEVLQEVILAFKMSEEAGGYSVTCGYLESRRIKGLPTFIWVTEYDDKCMIVTHWMPIVLPKEDEE